MELNLIYHHTTNVSVHFYIVKYIDKCNRKGYKSTKISKIGSKEHKIHHIKSITKSQKSSFHPNYQANIYNIYIFTTLLYEDTVLYHILITINIPQWPKFSLQK